MEPLIVALALVSLFIGFAVLRWQESKLNPKQQLWVSIGAMVLLVSIFVGFGEYHWTGILVGCVLAYSIYKRISKPTHRRLAGSYGWGGAIRAALTGQYCVLRKSNSPPPSPPLNISKSPSASISINAGTARIGNGAGSVPDSTNTGTSAVPSLM